MAKAKQQSSTTPVTPNFKDVDKEAVTRAQSALAGGRQEPLKLPKDVRTSTDSKGTQYSRFTESVSIQAAYRSVTKSKLMDVTVVVKIRQSEVNDGAKVFGHFYLNMQPDLPKGHDQMNDRSTGSIVSLLVATGFMPAGGALKGSLLDKMFPAKGQPGTASPLVGKTALANIVQQLGPMKDQKTGKPKLDDEGEPILEKRDNIESFLPEDAGSDDEDES